MWSIPILGVRFLLVMLAGMNVGLIDYISTGGDVIFLDEPVFVWTSTDTAWTLGLFTAQFVALAAEAMFRIARRNADPAFRTEWVGLGRV